MNYYERHIGDYLKDTAHLSLLEHGVYTRLMDVYYTRECSLPCSEVARLIGARTKAEQDALDSVLDEFFIIADETYVQTRCEHEIARYRDKQAKARSSANARWKPDTQHTERNANAMRTHSEGNAPRARLHAPSSSNQTPDTKTEQKKKQPQAALPDPPESINSDAWQGFVAMRIKERHPLTARAASLILAKLAAHPPDVATAMLDQSTRNGWRDVFDLKPNGSNGADHVRPRLSAAERVLANCRAAEERERIEAENG